jgi:xanthine dehydrogenase accessory factor
MSLSLAATMSLVEELRHRGEDFCLVTVIRTANATSAKAGAKAIVTRDGALHGFVGGGCVQGAATRTALVAMQAGEPRLIRVRPKEEQGAEAEGLELHDSHCPSGGTVDLFLEPMLQRTRIVICGASPVAATLAMLARAMGYETVAAASGADQAKIAAADRRIEGFDLSAVVLRAQDAVVVATQGRRDRDALKAALLSPAGYVGMVGSCAKIAKLLEQLDDVPEALRRRLRGPAGIDIGAIDPEEIALSILSEIVHDRRRPQRSTRPELLPDP